MASAPAAQASAASHGVGSFGMARMIADVTTMPVPTMVDTTPRVRPATADDLAAVQRCVNDAFTPYIARIGQPPGPMTIDHAAHIAAGHVWVAVGPTGVVGVLVAYPAEASLYIDTVAVSPIQQRTGAGRALLQFAERETKSQGFDAITLCTNAAMTENQVLYPKIGYVETGRRHAEGYDRVYYRKALGE
jgi:ribosomal protein S18 acetylase RimI-like enzyme